MEQKWQTLRWVTDHLDNNELELRAMLTDLREVENEELRKWNKMKRFDKIDKLRRENGSDDDKNQTDWKKKKS